VRYRVGAWTAGIEPVTQAAARALIVEDGRVVGVLTEHGGRGIEQRARRGVVLATGGFEWNEELVGAFLRGPMTGPASVPSNTGDGLRMAMQAGAALRNMREAWWMPVFKIPGDEYLGHPRSILTLRERTVPGTIMVNRRGVRFTNEAANYNALGAALHQFDIGPFQYANLPCWIVFDERCFRRYGFSVALPDTDPPEWIASASTVPGLAGKIAYRRTRSNVRSRGSTTTSPSRAATRTSVAATAPMTPSTGSNAARPAGHARAHRVARPTTQSRSTAVRSARRAGPERTRMDECSAWTATRSPVSTPRATPWQALPAWSTAAREGQSAPAMVFGYRAGRHAGQARQSEPSASLEAVRAS
jgi:3-oxosteroid 1-dehydrogenase